MSLTASRPHSPGIALFVLLAGTLPASCRSRGGANEQAPDALAAESLAAPASSSLGSIVASPKHDFGRVTQGDMLEHVFVTHNRTGAPMKLENTPEVLGCAGIAMPDALAPNQSGKFQVMCRATVHGPLRVSIPLRANGRPAGELTIAAEVEPLLTFDRALLDVNVPFGRAHESEARLGGKLARSARLTLAAPAPSGMNVRVLPAAGGKAEGVALRLAGPPVGVHAGALRFHSGLAEAPTVELPYSVKVTGTLLVSPTNPVLDLAAPGGARSLITVTSTQPGFRVERAEVIEGPFSARVLDAPSGHSVEVSLVAAKFPEGAHGANGRLRIVTNDRSEPTKELPLFALGKPRGASPAPSR